MMTEYILFNSIIHAYNIEAFRTCIGVGYSNRNIISQIAKGEESAVDGSWNGYALQ